MINKNYVKSIKNQNYELKKAAKETKKYAEKVKSENDQLKSQLEKANKKIKSIELAKGFDKCNDELLNKWEKIFTNCLVQVSREKGRREAKTDLKKFKSEFKKVITLNSNLQAQIEAISENRLMRGSNQASSRKGKNGEGSPLRHSPASLKFGNFKTAIPEKSKEDMKENVGFYLTEDCKNHNNHSQWSKKSNSSMKFPKPPLANKDEDEENSENLLSMMQGNSDSNSSDNEYEEELFSKNQAKSDIVCSTKIPGVIGKKICFSYLIC